MKVSTNASFFFRPSVVLSSRNKSLLLTGLFVLLGLSLQAQVVLLTYNSSGALVNEDVTACDGMALNQVRLVVTNNNADNMTVTLQLPPGITYMPGTVATVSQSGGLSVSENNISNPNAPVFSISPANLSAGNEIVIEWDRRSDSGCDAYNYVIGGGTLKDQIFVATDGGNISDTDMGLNSYDLLYASLSISGPAPITTTVGSTIMRSPITITNGGQGFLNEFTFYLVEGAGLNTTQLETSPGGTVIAPSGTNGDTTFYVLSGAAITEFGDGDAMFENGEQLVLKRTVQVLSCVTDNGYGAFWGCPGRCQSATFVNDQINIATGVPSVVLTASTPVQLTNMCDDLIYDYTYTNTGSETQSGAGTAFDLVMLYGINFSGATLIKGNNGLSFTDISVNGVAATFCTACNGNVGAYASLASFVSDPDGPGGLSDADGDGQFDDLPVGASVTVRVTIAYICNNACPSTHSSGAVKTAVDFKNQCDIAQTRNIVTAGPNFSNDPISALAVNGPADITDGQTFTVQGCFSRRESLPDNSAFFSCTTNALLYKVVLPAGFTPILSSGKQNGVARTAYQIADTVFVVGNASGDLLDGTCFSVDLTLDCASYVEKDFYVEVQYVCDNACACQEKWGCTDWLPNVHCPDPCPEGGLTTQSTKFTRLTMGFTDNTATARVNPASVPAANLLLATVCDTVQIAALSEQIGGTSGGGTQTWDNGYLRIEYDRFSNNNLLTYAGGTVVFYDASAGTHTTCSLAAPTQSVVSGKHVAIFDLTACLGGTLLQPGDSLNVFAKAVIRLVSGMQTAPTQPSGFNIYHYNLVNGLEYFCDNYALEWYLHRHRVELLSNTGALDINGCQTYTNSINPWILNVTTDLYPGEVRSPSRLDSLVLEFPTMDAISSPPFFSYRPDGGGAIVYTLPITPDAVYDGKMVWRNPGNWPVSDQSTNSLYSIRVNTVSTCASVDAYNRLTAYFTHEFTSEASECYRTEVVTGGGTISHDLPIMNVVNLSGVIQSSQNAVTWNTQIQNLSTIGASYVWVAFENDPNLQVTSVFNTTSGTPVTLIPYANGVWAQIATSQAGSSNINLEVTATYSGCNAASVPMLMGWNCPGYPTDPTVYPCTADQVVLEASPLPSEVQLQITGSPTPPLVACTPFAYELLLSSAQAAYLDNPVLAFKLPAGLIPTGPTVDVEYPDNSGNIEALSYTQSGDTLYVNLEDHSQIGAGGIPGTQDALNTDQREVRVDIEFSTGCAFTSGDRLKFIIGLGDRPCGDPAFGNRVTVTSADLFIQGAEPPYIANVVLDPGTNPLINCAMRMASIDLTMIAGAMAMTTPQDTVFITLGSGLSYIPGSFTNNGGLTLSYISTNGSGEQVLAIAMPATPIDLSAGAVMVHMNFEFSALSTSGCSTDEEITAELTNTIMGLVCPTEPSGMCSATMIVLGSNSSILTLQKTAVAFSSTTSGCTSADGAIRIGGEFEISGQDLPVGGTVVVDFYCADLSGNKTGGPIASYTVNGPIAAGTNVPFTATISGGCNPANGIVAEISNNQNCVCSNVEQLFSIGLPPATAMATLKACVAGPGMAMGNFTLTDADATVDPAGTNTVTYHNSYSDAQLDQNALTSPYMSTTANLWVRVEDPVTGCFAIDIVQLVVNPLPGVTCVNRSVCIATAPIILSGATPSGGTYSGTGVAGGVFDPSAAGVGTHTITYTYIDGNGCTNTCSFEITVLNVNCGTFPWNGN